MSKSIFRISMRIGICAYPLSKSKESGRGLERVIFEFCRYLDSHKVDYEFYGNDNLDKLKGSSSVIDELKSVFNSVKYLFQLRKTKNDIYLATYPVAAIFPLLLGKKHVVSMVHDLIPFFVHEYDNKIKYFIKRKSIRYACMKSDRLIVPFTSTREKICELFNIDKNKVFVIPYGVDTSYYYSDSSVLKIDNRIAFLGEAKRAKGLDSVIRAFKLVHLEKPEASLIMASKGNEISEMKKLASKLLNPNTFEFVEFVPENEMRRFYNQSDIFVFPSRYGFGLSSLEAMACGIPSIIGATLDAKDIFKDEDIMVNPDNIQDLADKILSLLNDRKLYENKKEEALALAERYNWDQICGEYLKVCICFDV